MFNRKNLKINSKINSKLNMIKFYYKYKKMRRKIKSNDLLFEKKVILKLDHEEIIFSQV